MNTNFLRVSIPFKNQSFMRKLLMPFLSVPSFFLQQSAMVVMCKKKKGGRSFGRCIFAVCRRHRDVSRQQ